MSNPPAMSIPSDTGVRAERRWWILAACVVAALAKNTEPPPSVFWAPEVAAFNAGWATYGFWMSVISLLSLAFLLIGGVLGDMFGRRRVMLIGLTGLLVGNLVVLLVPSVPWFIVARSIAGAFGVLVLPLLLSMLYLAFDDDAVACARAIAIYVLFTAIATLTAGLLGQLMNRLFDWRGTFLVPITLGIVAIALVRREVGESRVDLGRRVDVVGHAAWALTVLCAMASLLAAFSQRPQAGWVLTGALSGVGVGIALLVWWDRHTPDSIFGQSRIQRRFLIVLMIYGLCMQFGTIALVTQVRNVLQAVYAYGPVLASLALIPYVLGMLLMVLYASRRLVDADPRPILIGSLLAGGVFCATIGLTRAAGFYPVLALLLFGFGAAMVLAGTVFTFAFFIAVPSDALGVRTGINSSVRQLGGGIGNAMAAGLLAIYGTAIYQRMLLIAGVPSERIDEAMGALNIMLDPTSPGAAAFPDVGARLLAGYQVAYLAAYERVLLITALVCVIGALIAWVALPHRREKPVAESRQPFAGEP